VLADGVVVATLHTSRWKEAATAQVEQRSWVFSKDGRELTGRQAADPAGAVRLRARHTSWWRDTWDVELDGMPVEVATQSWWKGTHRYRSGGRFVAESGTTGRWSPRPTLTAADDLPLAAQVFLLWFEFVLGRRRAAGA
jgi:hypothetical protein